MKKAVFLDRDGLINYNPAPHCYISCQNDFVFMPGVADAIQKLNKAGYLVIVVTNQRGVARGIMTMDDVEDVHRYMIEELAKHGAHIDGIYVCPHNDGECNCRKPKIGLFLQAEKDFALDKSHSWMIGDSNTDIEAGERYGVRTLMTDNLSFAVDKILSDNLNNRIDNA